MWLIAPGTAAPRANGASPNGHSAHGNAAHGNAAHGDAAHGKATDGHGTPTADAESVHIGEMERQLIDRALKQAGGNKTRAARLLGLTRAQLYWRLEKHQIQA